MCWYGNFRLGGRTISLNNSIFCPGDNRVRLTYRTQNEVLFHLDGSEVQVRASPCTDQTDVESSQVVLTFL